MIMRNVFSWLRVVSMMFFLGALLLIYAYLPERVSLYSDNLGTPVYFVERGLFFYCAFGFFVLANLMFFVFNKMLDRVPVTGRKGFFTSDLFKEKTMIWLEIFVSLVNIFFVTSLVFLGVYNNPQTFHWANFSYLVYFGVFLILAGILSYGYVLRFRNYQLS